MQHILPALTLILAILTGLAELVAFLIGRDGTQLLKARLADWYVYLKEGDWSLLIISAARVADGFFNALLGPALISARAVITWVAISLAYGILTVYALANAPAVPQRTSIFQAAHNLLVTFPYYPLADFAALTYSRYLLRRLATGATRRGAYTFTWGTLVVAYVAVTLCFLVFGFSSQSFQHGCEQLAISFIGCFALAIGLWLIWPVTVTAYAISAHEPDLLLAVFVVVALSCASALVLLALVTGAWLLYVSRPITGNALSHVVERLAESPNVLTTVIGGLTLISGIVSHLQDYLKAHAR